jgi:NADPH-dependent glutamate synthase beta subunit-like oxidoreductase
MRVMESLIAMSHKPITGNKVGSWRFVEPFLENKKAPCQAECPVGQDVRSVMDLVAKGQEKEAFYMMADKNPLLYSTGTVCPHYCEQGCNRQYVDAGLHISNIEKTLGKKFLDQSLSVLKKEQQIQKKVAIIGGGPAGISAAYQLARYSAEVDLFEREKELGGILRFGIPDLRLDKLILKKEIDRVIRSFPNIKVHSGQEIRPENLEKFKEKYDLILLAAGHHFPIPSSFQNVWYGLEVLKKFHQKQYRFPAQGKYLVLGGGNTAMDVAFYLLEHQNQVSVLVRKEKQKMRAFSDEISMVEARGARIIDHAQLKDWDQASKRAVMNLNQKESRENIDGVFVCFGQKEENIWENIEIGEKLQKIGDISGENATVSNAVFSGYKTVHQWLFPNREDIHSPDVKIITHKDMNMDYWKHQTDFRKDAVNAEAERCLQCGTCTSCGVCETFCPDFAIKTGEKEASFNYDYCKGCEICSFECPRGAVSIREVTS